MGLRILLTLLIIVVSGCNAFYHPMFLSLEIPDGPPEFKAGWHDGCITALSSGKSANGGAYLPSAGSGVYQHDQVYQDAWSAAFLICVITADRGTSDNIFAKTPAD